MKNLFITITLSFFTLNFYGQSIESPNSEFELNFYLDKKGRPFYNLRYKKEKIIENSGLDNTAKEKLLKLKPRDYIGLAKKLALKKI